MARLCRHPEPCDGRCRIAEYTDSPIAVLLADGVSGKWIAGAGTLQEMLEVFPAMCVRPAYCRTRWSQYPGRRLA
jgi:hypothetical protein